MKSLIWSTILLLVLTLLVQIERASAQSENMLPVTTKSAGWAFAQFGAVKGVLSTGEQANSLEVTIVQPDGTDWHGTLSSPPVHVTDGNAYTVTFAARASAPMTVGCNFTTADGDYHQAGFYSRTDLTTTWSNYRYAFQASNSAGHPTHVNFLLGAGAGSVWVSNVRFVAGAPTTLSADSSIPSAWSLELHNQAQAVTAQDGDALRVTTTLADGTDWHVQVYQTGIALAEGQSYTISFDAKSDRLADIYLNATSQQTFREVGLAATMHLTPSWQKISYTFKAHGVNGELVRLPDLRLGGQIGTVWIKNATLMPTN